LRKGEEKKLEKKSKDQPPHVFSPSTPSSAGGGGKNSREKRENEQPSTVIFSPLALSWKGGRVLGGKKKEKAEGTEDACWADAAASP